MIPRLRFDIGWSDLAYAALACFGRSSADSAADALERSLGSANAVAALSVRSGFDALIHCLALAPGDEVIMTHITIPNMVEIAELHGLRVVPVSVDTDSLAVSADAVERAITKRTRLIVVAHLLGSRMPLDAIAALAAKHNVALVEDAAQAFQGDGYRGHPDSTACMFSFGAIKTATALGGAILYFAHSELAVAVRRRLRAHPVLPRRWYAWRILRFSLGKLISYRLVFSLFVRGCRLTGAPYDDLLRAWVRGFTGSDLLAAIRRAPPAALLALLTRRLTQDQASRVDERSRRGAYLAECLPGVARPGSRAESASYWVFPVWDGQAERRASDLAQRGFDATTAASTLAMIVPAETGDPRCRLRPLECWLYLPQPHGMTPSECHRLGNWLRAQPADRDD